MEFEWDEAKSDRCRRERGFSFADVVAAFADLERRIEEDARRDHGEQRFRLYGKVAGRLFVVVFTRRGRAIRIISARKANARERRRYDAGTAEA